MEAGISIIAKAEVPLTSVGNPNILGDDYDDDDCLLLPDLSNDGVIGSGGMTKKTIPNEGASKRRTSLSSGYKLRKNTKRACTKGGGDKKSATRTKKVHTQGVK